MDRSIKKHGSPPSGVSHESLLITAYYADSSALLVRRKDDGSLERWFIASDLKKQSARNLASMEALRYLGVNLEALK